MLANGNQRMNRKCYDRMSVGDARGLRAGTLAGRLLKVCAAPYCLWLCYATYYGGLDLRDPRHDKVLH